MGQKTIEVVERTNKKHRITITTNRATLKIKPDTPEDERKVLMRLFDLAQRTYEDTPVSVRATVDLLQATQHLVASFRKDNGEAAGTISMMVPSRNE